MPRKSTGEYPPNWKVIAQTVKDAAGWRLLSRPVLPVIFDMAIPAQRNQIAQGIGLAILAQAKVAKGDDVSNGQFFFELSSMFAAVLACVVITMSSLTALRSPVWPIVFLIATLPVWAFLAGEMRCKPPQTAHVAAESLLRGRCRDGSLFAALLAFVGNSVRLALIGAKLCRCSFCRRCSEFLAASLACDHDGRMSSGLRAFLGAIHLLRDSGMRACKRVAAVGARFACGGVFALTGTVAPAASFGGIFLKLFTASFTSEGDLHAQKISYRVEIGNSEVMDYAFHHDLPHDRESVMQRADWLIALGQGMVTI